MLVLKIVMCLAFCLWILLMWRRRKFYLLMLKIRGPIGLPLLGVLHKITSLEDILLYINKLQKQKYVSPILTWAGPIPVFGIYDPQTAQDILISPHCVNRSILYEPINKIIGYGLLSSANPDWSIHRKLLNPAFGQENLRSFVPIFNDKTKAFAQDFAISYGGEPINILPIMQRLTMNMALQTTMGLSKGNTHDAVNEESSKYDELFEHYHYLAEKAMSLIAVPWLRLEFVQNILPSFKKYKTSKRELRKYFINLIQDKLSIPSTIDAPTKKLSNSPDVDDVSQNKEKHIFIDIAIELFRSGKFTYENVVGHTNHIVAGAFETTAATVTHALTLLAMNSQQQEIAFEEISSLFADRDNVTVTEEDLHHLRYLEMTINETMRLIPTVPIIGRTATSDVQLSSGVVIPSGIQIVISLFHLHRNVDIWGPQALIFNPENFLPENLRDKHPYSFIPFTKGIRSCIGWRYGLNATKIILATILRKYRITTTGKFEDLRYEPTISTRLIDPPLLQLHLRKN